MFCLGIKARLVSAKQVPTLGSTAQLTEGSSKRRSPTRSSPTTDRMNVRDLKQKSTPPHYFEHRTYNAIRCNCPPEREEVAVLVIPPARLTPL